jgi:hypothetical protein
MSAIPVMGATAGLQRSNTAGSGGAGGGGEDKMAVCESVCSLWSVLTDWNLHLLSTPSEEI